MDSVARAVLLLSSCASSRAVHHLSPVVIEQNVDTDYSCCNLYNRSHPIVFPGGAPGRPDTAPADTLSECIDICKGLYFSNPPCKAAAWNRPSKQCYLKSGKANPHAKPGDTSFLLGVGPTSVEIAPGLFQPYVNLGGVTGAHASNWSDFLGTGGRGIDTALTYGDDVQKKVAASIAASGVPRSEVFLATKVPCCPNVFGAQHGGPGAHCGPSTPEFNGSIAHDVARNLELLGPHPPDLTLLHWPCDTVEQTLVAWRGLEAALHAGKTRAIGVSNFNATLLAKLLPQMKVKPAVNQCGHSIGHHTLNQTAATSKAGYTGGEDETASFCAQNGIQ